MATRVDIYTVNEFKDLMNDVYTQNEAVDAYIMNDLDFNNDYYSSVATLSYPLHIYGQNHIIRNVSFESLVNSWFLIPSNVMCEQCNFIDFSVKCCGGGIVRRTNGLEHFIETTITGTFIVEGTREAFLISGNYSKSYIKAKITLNCSNYNNGSFSFYVTNNSNFDTYANDSIFDLEIIDNSVLTYGGGITEVHQSIMGCGYNSGLILKITSSNHWRIREDWSSSKCYVYFKDNCTVGQINSEIVDSRDICYLCGSLASALHQAHGNPSTEIIVSESDLRNAEILNFYLSTMDETGEQSVIGGIDTTNIANSSLCLDINAQVPCLIKSISFMVRSTTGGTVTAAITDGNNVIQLFSATPTFQRLTFNINFRVPKGRSSLWVLDYYNTNHLEFYWDYIKGSIFETHYISVVKQYNPDAELVVEPLAAGVWTQKTGFNYGFPYIGYSRVLPVLSSLSVFVIQNRGLLPYNINKVQNRALQALDCNIIESP